jgi:predicted secreted Zn-dependent protease
VDLTLQQGAQRGATAASTVGVTSTERGAPPGTAPVTGDDSEASIAVRTNTEEYTISGDSAAELLRSIDRVGPLGQQAERRAGHTDWHVDYHYRYDRSAEGCRTRPVSAEVNISYEMPHWATEPVARLSLQTEWNRFIAALWVHERGHGEHGIRAANDIKAELEGLPPQPDCETAGARANAIAQEILKRYEQIEVDYDRQTEYGKAQGATLENR